MKTLYYNGTIVTMAYENAEEEVYPEALLSDGHQILAVGSYAELRALADDVEEVDLQGHTLMPGFIDGHSHLPMAAQFIAWADLSSCGNFDDIITALKEYQEERQIKEGGAIIGYNYDHNFLKEGRHPNRLILDQVSDRIPVFILHISSHMGVANSVLLDMVGYGAKSLDPPGGHLGRMEGSMEPDGYLEEVAAFAPAMQKVYGMTQSNPLDLMDKIQDQYLSYGVTTAQDGASSADMLQLLNYAAMTGHLKMDVVSYIESRGDYETLLKQFGGQQTTYNNHWRLGGMKVVLDGSPQAKTAWLSKPYEGDTYCGYPAWSDEQLRKVTDYAVQNGYQLLAHCNGDAASEQFLVEYKASCDDSEKEKWEDLRPVMIHCQTVREDQLKRMNEVGMIPSIFVGHVYYWGDVHLKNLGDARGNKISPVNTALKCGLKPNFHQDTPVTVPDMMHSVWCAVNRITRDGITIGEEEKTSVYEALKCITIHAAYAYHEEATKGSLAAGKLADLVILERNPLEVEKDALKDIHVLQTIVHQI